MVKKSANPSGSTKEGLEVELSGLFGTLGNAVDLLGKLTEAGVRHLQHQDEFTLKGLGDGARGVYRAARIHGARHRRARRRRAHRQLPAPRGGRQQLSQRQIREQPAQHDGAHTRARRGHGAVRPPAGALRHDCAGRGFGRGAAPRTTLPGVHRAAGADARPDRAGAQGVLVRGRHGGRSGAGERDDSPDARRPQRTFAD